MQEWQCAVRYIEATERALVCTPTALAQAIGEGHGVCAVPTGAGYAGRSQMAALEAHMCGGCAVVHTIHSARACPGTSARSGLGPGEPRGVNFSRVEGEDILHPHPPLTELVQVSFLGGVTGRKKVKAMQLLDEPVHRSTRVPGEQGYTKEISTLPDLPAYRACRCR